MLPQRNLWAGNMLDWAKASRRALFHCAVATVALAAAVRAQAVIPSPLNSGPQPAEIRIVATEFHFFPDKLLIVEGRPILLVLDNSGAETEHGIIIPALGFRMTAMAGEIVRKTAVFDRPGEYEFSCDLPGHRESGMKGTLIVGRF